MFKIPLAAAVIRTCRVSLLLLATAAPFLMAAAPMNGSAWRSELAQLRHAGIRCRIGRDAREIHRRSVSFFGVSMLTSWQDQNGVTTVARLAFNVDFLVQPGGSNPVPTITVDWMREGDPDMDVRGLSNGYVAFTVTPDQVVPMGR